MPLQRALWARPALPMVALTAIYGVCFVAIKAGLPYAPPLLFAGLRTLIGGAVLLGLVLMRRQPLVPARWAWPWILAAAVSATTVSFGAMFLSPGRAGAGLAAVLGNLQPLLVIALAAPVLGERLTRRTALALALGLTGVLLIAAPTLFGPGRSAAVGAVLALAASAGAAGGSVLMKRMGRPAAVPLVTAWQLVVGSAPLLAASAFVEHGARVRWTAEFVGLLLFLAVVGTALTTAVWYALIQRHDVGRLSLFFFLVPVFGLAAAVVAFGESVGRLEGVGIGVIIAGIITAAVEVRTRGAAQGAPQRSARRDPGARAPGRR